MATELHLQVFVLVWVTVNAPLIQASLVRITHSWSRTGTRISVNDAVQLYLFIDS